MIRLLPILAVLLLTGCATERQINPGADIPIVVIHHDMLQRKAAEIPGFNGMCLGMARHDPPAEIPGFNGMCLGMARHDPPKIYVSHLLGPNQRAAVILHEFAHLYERRSGDDRIWRLIYATGGTTIPHLVQWPVHSDDHPLRKGIQ